MEAGKDRDSLFPREEGEEEGGDATSFNPEEYEVREGREGREEGDDNDDYSEEENDTEEENEQPLLESLEELASFVLPKAESMEDDGNGKAAFLKKAKEVGLTFPVDAIARRLHETEFRIPYVGLSDRAVQCLVYALEFNETIRTLDLSKNDMTSKGLAILFEKIRNNFNLMVIDVSYNFFQGSDGDSALEALAEYLRAGPSPLAHLNLSHCRLGALRIDDLCEAILANKTLSTIDMAENGLGAPHTLAIGKLLRESIQIRVLRLDFNSFSEDQCVQLMSAIRANGSLTEFSFSWNGMSDRSAKELSEAIADSITLLELNISHNRIGIEGAKSLASGIGRNHRLSKLSLEGNLMGNEGCIAILTEALPHSTLEYLNINGCGTSDATVRFIEDFPKQNRKLEHLVHGMPDHLSSAPPIPVKNDDGDDGGHTVDDAEPQ